MEFLFFCVISFNMGLNLNYTKEDGQQAFYWKISRVENWFQGTTGPDTAPISTPWDSRMKPIETKELPL